MIQWNQVIWSDCLDQKVGMPSLPPKSIDFCFTDPPFNIALGLKEIRESPIHNKSTTEDDHIIYTDQHSEYKEWCRQWFSELKRICNVIVIYCGPQNEAMWYEIEKPYGKAYANRKNPSTGFGIAHLVHIYPILIYGKPKHRLNHDVLDYLALWGFLREHTYTHPCPLNFDFWMELVSQFHPSSVIDPFMGSGTTANVCEQLGIKWIGYEIMQEYQKDFQYRMQKVKGQMKLAQFCENDD